jgi:hypothetical protein
MFVGVVTQASGELRILPGALFLPLRLHLAGRLCAVGHLLALDLIAAFCHVFQAILLAFPTILPARVSY